MKSIVGFLTSAVRRAPVAVIVIVVVISMALGALSGNFTPEEDSNASFAPEAPELDAAERIPELFGEESSESVMQVIITAPEGGNVYSADGLATVQTLTETVRTGALEPILSDQEQRPAVISFMFPVESAVQQGAPVPTSDAEVQALLQESLGQLPPEQSGFVSGLLPTDADLAASTADKGLMLIFTTGAESTELFDQFVDQSALAADEITATALPGGYTAEPFAFELLFAGQDEFQDEILTLLLAAVFIILTVLAAVYFVRPKNRFAFAIIGFLALIAATVAFVADVIPLPAMAGVVALVFLLWTFSAKGLRRTTADTMVTLITIFFAISWMNGIGFLLFEDANPMAQILPILLIGLGVDYAIHITSRYREEVSAGETVELSITSAIRTVGIALVLATITTAVGFLTNVVNEIPALREFGVLAAVGIAVSFLLMLTFVPSVRLLLDRRAERAGTLDREVLEGGDSRFLGRVVGGTAGLARRAPAATIVVALVLGAVGAFGVTQLETKFSFLDFVPTTSPLRGTFETLLDDFGGGFGESTQVLIEGDVGTADAWNAMVASNANVADTANVLLFAGNPAAASPISVILPLAQPESPTFVPEVGAALQAAGMDEATLQVPQGADVNSIYAAAAAAAPDAVRGVLHANGSGGYDAALFDITTQAGEGGAGQLRVDLLEDFMPVRDAGPSTVVTSDEIINDVVVTTLRDSQVSSLALTLAAALILLVVNFTFEARRPMLGVITTIPVVLVVLWSFGLMAAFGIPFGPVTATISALAIGIGIPYMIHITHRYLEDRIRYSGPNEAVGSTLSHTGGALAGSALTTVAGFGILTTSTTIPFQQFGFVTAYTILLAMLAAVLILPSMLVLWDRWHRNRGEAVVDEATVHEVFDKPAEGVPGA